MLYVCSRVPVVEFVYGLTFSSGHIFSLNSITQVLVDIMEVFIMQVLSFAIMEDDKNMFDNFFMYEFFIA